MLTKYICIKNQNIPFVLSLQYNCLATVGTFVFGSELQIPFVYNLFGI